MSVALSYTASIKVCDCSVCGAPIALSGQQYRERLEDRKTFWCPNGHTQHFIGKSEAEKLKEELERERKRRELAENTAQMEATRAERAINSLSRANKKLDRVKKGVCPCCKRSFTNLRRHMETKHPEELK